MRRPLLPARRLMDFFPRRGAHARPRPRYLVVLSALVAVVLVLSGVAGAYFSLTASGTATAKAVTLSAPTLSHGTVTANSVPLSWTAGSPSLTYTYKVYRCTGTGCTPSVQVPSGGCSGALATASCTDTTAAAAKTYEYAVVDVYHQWSSTKSTSVKVTTPSGSPTLTLTAPSSDPTSTAIAAVTITATLSGASSPTGHIAFYYKKTTSGTPSTCTSGFTKLGSTITVTGNASYHPTTGYTPSTAGHYFWYATFTDTDGHNSNANSTCGTGMAETVVSTPATTSASLVAKGSTQSNTGTCSTTRTTCSVTSASFNTTSGAIYLIFAAHTSTSSTSDAAALTSSGFSSITAETSLTNVSKPGGATAHTEPDWEWVWVATGNTATSVTATVDFADKSPKKTTTAATPYNFLVILKLTGVASNPIANDIITDTKTVTQGGGSKATINLLSTSTNTQLILFYLGADPSPNTPGWTPSATITALVYGYHSGGPTSGDGVLVATAKAGLGSVVADPTGGWPAKGSDAFAAIDLQLAPASAPPTVSSLSASSGSTSGGTTVTITGTNFTATPTVHFGSATATVVGTPTSTSITVHTPAHAAGSVDVTVTTTSGTSAKSSADIYTYNTLPAPTVTGVSPRTGSTGGGTSVTITGKNFVSGASVTFGSGNAGSSPVVHSSTTITVTTPAHASGTVDVTVTTTGGMSAKSSADLYTFDTPTPTVTAISPSSGSIAGTTNVTITGTNFKPGSTVTFGTGHAATNVVVHSSTSITATSPAHTTGTVDVTVTTTGGTSATSSADIFTYGTPTPTVTSVSPSTGLTTGGTSVTITGTNFTAASTVYFGSTQATTNLVVHSSTSITVTSPAHVAGQVTVFVHDGSNASGSGHHFTYLAPPTVTGVSPASGSATTTTANVVISGTNFSSSVTVHFGSVVASTVTRTSSIKITATAPSQSARAVDVTVTDSDSLTSATSSADIFTYGSPTPTVTGVSPASGSATTTTSGVVITGTNFTPSVTVKFGTSTATVVTVNSSTSITATAPSQSARTVDVTVEDSPDNITSATSSADIFKYGTPTPSISSINPTSGAAGTSVTITGTNFTSSVVVDFGANASTSVTVHSSTSITATAPSGSGTVAVEVIDTNGTGNSSTNTHMFTYQAISSIASVGTASTFTGPSAHTFTTSNTYGPEASTKVVLVFVTGHENVKHTTASFTLSGGPASSWHAITTAFMHEGPGDTSLVEAFWGQGSGGGSASAITVAASGAGGNHITVGVVEVAVVTGATTSTAVKTSAIHSGKSTTASVTFPAPSSGDAQVFLAAEGNAKVSTFSTPSGFTPLQSKTAASGGTHASEGGFYRLPATATSGTVSSTVATTTWGVIGIELKG